MTNMAAAYCYKGIPLRSSGITFSYTDALSSVYEIYMCGYARNRNGMHYNKAI